MSKIFKIFLPAAVVIAFFIFFSSNEKNISISPSNAAADINNSIWTDVAEGSFSLQGERRIIPSEYRVVRTSFSNLKYTLSTAPFEFTERAKNFPFIIELPLPNGTFGRFSVTEYSMMEPELAVKFPEFKTYNLQGIDDPYAAGKMDITSHGFHAMVMTPRGTFFIDPYSTNETEVYISYYKKDYHSSQEFKCETIGSDNSTPTITDGLLTSGPQLRTYRLACAATGEYTVYHGGTVNSGMAAIVTAINRVNGVYEIDFSVRMVLIANNNLIVYTNGATDPYTNNNGSTMLGQNQTNLDNVIGSANYDFGHVFSTGGGGVAFLGCICNNSTKARGVTGLPSPIGDPFYIDYVAHEMGHQFGGNHTFNSTTSSCGGGNRNGSTAYEPGSGSTIMAYAGICGSSNLQNNSDPYFHTISFSEIATYTQNGLGNTCAAITNTGNTPPQITMPQDGYTIPISTPFALTGSATDTETPNTLTYCWEEFDLGPAGTPNNPSGDAPIFRSFNPDTSKTRTFPKISDLLNNSQTIGEILPTYTRNLKFRLTVRDNTIAAGGVNYELVQYSVTSTAGPFLMVQPNTAVIWNTNLPQVVIWNVANTNVAPVNCTNVNIKLSTDGGYTYPHTLASNTPNDGTEIVNLPQINSTTARIKVEAAGNIFFDISNTNFTTSTLVNVHNLNTGIPERFNLSQNYPNPFNPATKINFDLPVESKVVLKIYDISGKLVSELVNGIQPAGYFTATFDASNISSGMYFYRLEATGNEQKFEVTKKMLLVK